MGDIDLSTTKFVYLLCTEKVLWEVIAVHSSGLTIFRYEVKERRKDSSLQKYVSPLSYFNDKVRINYCKPPSVHQHGGRSLVKTVIPVSLKPKRIRTLEYAFSSWYTILRLHVINQPNWWGTLWGGSSSFTENYSWAKYQEGSWYIGFPLGNHEK